MIAYPRCLGKPPARGQLMTGEFTKTFKGNRSHRSAASHVGQREIVTFKASMN